MSVHLEDAFARRGNEATCVFPQNSSTHWVVDNVQRMLVKQDHVLPFRLESLRGEVTKKVLTIGAFCQSLGLLYSV